MDIVCRLLGVDRVVAFALSEWLQDIKKTQLPSLLGGVGPLYSLVQLGQWISLCSKYMCRKLLELHIHVCVCLWVSYSTGSEGVRS